MGPAIIGSPDVWTNSRPSLRVDDIGVHAACCNTNLWKATKGAQTVFINNKPAHRMHDAQRHCGGDGKLIEGSPNVMVEDATGGGGGGGATGANAAGRAGSGGGAASASTSAATAGGTSAAGDDANAAPSGGDTSEASAREPASSEPDVPIEPDELEVRVVRSTGAAADGIRYELTMPSGEVVSGSADVNGVIKLTGLRERGDCTLRFPKVDDERPEPA